MGKAIRLTAFIALASLCFAPASCDQSVDKGNGTGDAQVEVTYGGESRTVALDGLATATLAGKTVVALDVIIAEAGFDASLEGLWLDFVADDGFSPSQGAYCPPSIIPVKGTLAGKGGLEVKTRNLLWDTALEFPGCMHVDGVATIKLSGTGTDTDSDAGADTDADKDGDTDSVAVAVDYVSDL
jgi:hypothetical protein